MKPKRKLMTESNETKPLTHRIDGQGVPVLLLNGGLMSIAAWEPIAAKLWLFSYLDGQRLRWHGPVPF